MNFNKIWFSLTWYLNLSFNAWKVLKVSLYLSGSLSRSTVCLVTATWDVLYLENMNRVMFWPSFLIHPVPGVVLTSLSSQPPAAAAPAPAPATSAWGKSSSGGPFRTLSEVVRSSVRPAEVAAVATTTAAATTNATTTVTANTSAAPYVDYFDFTS